jgi:hypothetical protein
MAYTDITEVQTYLKTTFDGTTVPTSTEVTQWITDTDSEVDRLAGTTFTSTAHTEFFDLVNFNDRVILSKYPVISITSAEYNDYSLANPTFNPNWVAFDNHSNNDAVVIFDKQLAGENRVKVVYNYGYTTTPSEVKHLATLLVVKKIISNDGYAKNSTSSLSIGPLSITKNVGLSRLINLDNDIANTLKRIGKYQAILR